jgi:hypothetical protein
MEEIIIQLREQGIPEEYLSDATSIVIERMDVFGETQTAAITYVVKFANNSGLA